MAGETEFRRRETAAWKLVAAGLGLIAALFGSFQALITLPVRVDGHEQRLDKQDARMEKHEQEERVSREILIRIEEQVRQVREALRRGN